MATTVTVRGRTYGARRAPGVLAMEQGDHETYFFPLLEDTIGHISDVLVQINQSATDAANSATSASGSATTAQGHATDALAHSNSAEDARDAARGFRDQAQTSADTASTHADTAVSRAQAASLSADSAMSQAQAAANSASQAATSASNAADSAQRAEDAADGLTTPETLQIERDGWRWQVENEGTESEDFNINITRLNDDNTRRWAMRFGGDVQGDLFRLDQSSFDTDFGGSVRSLARHFFNRQVFTSAADFPAEGPGPHTIDARHMPRLNLDVFGTQTFDIRHSTTDTVFTLFIRLGNIVANPVIVFNGNEDNLTWPEGRPDWAGLASQSVIQVRAEVYGSERLLLYWRNTAEASNVFPGADDGDDSESDTEARASAEAAALSADAAMSQAEAAAMSAQAAANAATNAAEHSTTAGGHAAAAATSETNAATSAAGSQMSLDTFRANWLGEATVDPLITINNDPVEGGALYYNTVMMRLRFFDGTNWHTLDVGTASADAAAQSATEAAASAAAAATSSLSAFQSSEVVEAFADLAEGHEAAASASATAAATSETNAANSASLAADAAQRAENAAGDPTELNIIGSQRTLEIAETNTDFRFQMERGLGTFTFRHDDLPGDSIDYWLKIGGTSRDVEAEITQPLLAFRSYVTVDELLSGFTNDRTFEWFDEDYLRFTLSTGAATWNFTPNLSGVITKQLEVTIGAGTIQAPVVRLAGSTNNVSWPDTEPDWANLATNDVLLITTQSRRDASLRLWWQNVTV